MESFRWAGRSAVTDTDRIELHRDANLALYEKLPTVVANAQTGIRQSQALYGSLSDLAQEMEKAGDKPPFLAKAATRLKNMTKAELNEKGALDLLGLALYKNPVAFDAVKNLAPKVFERSEVAEVLASFLDAPHLDPHHREEMIQALRARKRPSNAVNTKVYDAIESATHTEGAPRLAGIIAKSWPELAQTEGFAETVAKNIATAPDDQRSELAKLVLSGNHTGNEKVQAALVRALPSLGHEQLDPILATLAKSGELQPSVVTALKEVLEMPHHDGVDFALAKHGGSLLKHTEETSPIIFRIVSLLERADQDTKTGGYFRDQARELLVGLSENAKISEADAARLVTALTLPRNARLLKQIKAGAQEGAGDVSKIVKNPNVARELIKHSFDGDLITALNTHHDFTPNRMDPDSYLVWKEIKAKADEPEFLPLIANRYNSREHREVFGDKIETVPHDVEGLPAQRIAELMQKPANYDSHNFQQLSPEKLVEVLDTVGYKSEQVQNILDQYVKGKFLRAEDLNFITRALPTPGEDAIKPTSPHDEKPAWRAYLAIRLIKERADNEWKARFLPRLLTWAKQPFRGPSKDILPTGKDQRGARTSVGQLLEWSRSPLARNGFGDHRS